MEINMAKKN